MAAVSVGRGSNPASSAYRGQALTRSSDPPTETQRMEKQMDIDYGKKAIKMLKKAATRLRTHNWDKGRGQPGWVFVEHRPQGVKHTVSAGNTFSANIGNVGPGADEVDMVMPWNREFETTGGESCTASSEARRISFTCPPEVYPKEDQHRVCISRAPRAAWQKAVRALRRGRSDWMCRRSPGRGDRVRALSG